MTILLRTLALLESGEKGTKHDIARMLNCSDSAVKQALRILHRKHKVHVLAWTRSGNLPLAIFKAGNNKGKRRPRPMTKAAQRAQYKVAKVAKVAVVKVPKPKIVKPKVVKPKVVGVKVATIKIPKVTTLESIWF